MTKAIQIKTMTLGSGMPKICVPMTGTTQEILWKEADTIRAAAPDLVEWRGDYYEALQVPEKLLETLSGIVCRLGGIPLLFTIRTTREGGRADLTTQEYGQINLTVAKSGQADLIDVEVFGDEMEKCRIVKELQQVGVRVIASSHDFEKTDSTEVLLERFRIMDRTGADILKMAVMPQSFSDVTALLQVTEEAASNLTDKPVITMSMGRLGAISRICGEQSGSALTFGTVGEASAPGQIPIEILRGMLKALH
jgi:3-dehydroquinate dehydratase-1